MKPTTNNRLYLCFPNQRNSFGLGEGCIVEIVNGVSYSTGHCNPRFLLMCSETIRKSEEECYFNEMFDQSFKQNTSGWNQQLWIQYLYKLNIALKIKCQR